MLKIHHHHHRAHSAAMVAPSHLCSHGSCCYKRKKKQVSNEVVIQFIEISWNIVVKCEENCKTVCRKNKVKLVKVKWTLNASYPLVKRASAIQLKQDAVYVVQSVPADFAAGVRPCRTSVAFLHFFSFFFVVTYRLRTTSFKNPDSCRALRGLGSGLDFGTNKKLRRTLSRQD